MNITNPTTFGSPNLTLSTSNSSGTAGALRSDDTILVYDTTAVDAITFGQSGSVGSASTASRRDHAHAMAADPANLVLIESIEADDTNYLTIGGLDSTYDVYMVALSNIIPAADANAAWIRVGDAEGIDAGASDYAYHTMNVTDASASYAAEASDGAAGIRLGAAGVGNADGEGLDAVLWLYRPTDTSTYPTLSGTHSYTSATGVLRGGTVIGGRLAAITMTQVQYRNLGGNVTSGRMTVWGVVHA